MLRALLPLLVVAALPAAADEPLPKLGPLATPVMAETEYLRQAPAPDFWAFAPFVHPQFTSSACSVAAVTAALNGLRGLPALADDTIPSQQDVLELTGNALWAELSAEDGDGVTFQQLEIFTHEALAALDMAEWAVTSHRADSTPAEDLRALLAENERDAGDAVLVYYNQGVVTGDWDGPHIALIGAFDAARDRVLILEVDQEWYVHYWTDFDTLVAAMLRPTSDEHGPLEGETGGLVHIHRGG